MASTSKRGSTEASAIDLATDSEDDAPKAKVQRTEHDATEQGASSISQPTPFLLPAGASSLRGVHVPRGWTVHGSTMLVCAFGSFKPTAKVAAFDFDGCLARTSLGGVDPTAWSLLFQHVPSVLAKLHASGHCIVIITNESLDRLKKPDAIRATILKKTGRLTGFAAAAGVPLLALCATAKDTYRKPDVGAWNFFCEKCARPTVCVDLGGSFYVGDAAGRPATPNRPKADFSDSDRKFAASAGLAFYTETQFFSQMHPP